MAIPHLYLDRSFFKYIVDGLNGSQSIFVPAKTLLVPCLLTFIDMADRSVKNDRACELYKGKSEKQLFCFK